MELDIYMKAKRVIDSCEKPKHFDGAMNYLILVQRQYPQLFEQLLNYLHKKRF